MEEAERLLHKDLVWTLTMAVTECIHAYCRGEEDLLQLKASTI